VPLTIRQSIFTRRNVPTWLSIATFLLCLTQVAYYDNLPDDPAPSAAVAFFMGWLGMITGNFEWLANPALLFSWIAALRRRIIPSLISASLSVLLIVSFLRRAEVVYYGDNVDRHAVIQAYGPGYWLWLASALLMVLSNAVAWSSLKRKAQT
jgi:hypothetical protein